MKTPLLLVIAACVAPTIAAPETLDPTNVHRLSVAWTYDTGDSTEAVGKGADRPAFEATPVYSDGRLFLSTPLGTLVALDAERGTEVWRTDLGIRKDAHYGDPANRGPALSGGRLFVGTIDARLVCLQSRDGSRCPGFGKNGEIDLTKGLRHPPKYAGEYGVTSPPAVYRNLVIVGSSIGDNSRARMASGEVRAFDASTGALKWTFHTLPADATTGGANAWSGMAVDESRGLLFVPTGSPSPDYFGGLRAGRNDHANSIVVLRAATGELVWAFQTVHHDLWDYDVASPPLLFPFEKSGKGASRLQLSPSAPRPGTSSCSIG
jgi:quinoprotein glucose dehydrogenase